MRASNQPHARPAQAHRALQKPPEQHTGLEQEQVDSDRLPIALLIRQLEVSTNHLARLLQVRRALQKLPKQHPSRTSNGLCGKMLGRHEE